MNEIELYHHGIKGMKWGVRRFQKADGSLTDAGRKRYGQRIVEGIKERSEARKVERARHKIMTKDTRKLSDEELQYRINRLNSERMALTIDKDISRLSAKEIGAGRKFLGTFTSRVVGDSAINAGRTVFTKFLEKKIGSKLGVDGDDIDDGVKALKKEVEKLRLGKEKIDLDGYIKRGGKDDPNSDEAVAKAAKRAANEKLLYDKTRELENARARDRAAYERDVSEAIARAERSVSTANQYEFVTRGQSVVDEFAGMVIDDFD